MLNISKNKVSHLVGQFEFVALKRSQAQIDEHKSGIKLSVVVLVIVVCFFLPWTQNIESKGGISTRRPSDRPQSIQSVIDGKIEKWFVQEGDFVQAGDTIVHLSEVKNEYFDPDLIGLTQDQVTAKDLSVQSYESKVQALQLQYKSLSISKQAKLNQIKNKFLQAKNKVSIDSVDLVALRQEKVIMENQVERNQKLFDQGLKTLSDLQKKQIKLQQLQGKVSIQENKLENRKNELKQIQFELKATEADYANKMAKSMSDKQSALSNQLDAKVKVSKLKNTLNNYSMRQNLYYVTASRTGYIAKTTEMGIGQIVKSGSEIVTIMPTEVDFSIISYVKPRDLPLVQKGNLVSLRFDGYPAIQLNGWPGASVGVFFGKVDFVDPNIADNGKYRVIITPDPTKRAWPEDIRVGLGVQSFILLDDVPVWYEIWRQLNGFPQNYYEHEVNSLKKKKKKSKKSEKKDKS